MNPWREVLKALQAELDRLSQEIEGQAVLPNAATAILPAVRFERWAPILGAVTAELGRALVDWVGASRRRWYADSGPFLTVRLDAERPQPEIRCQFLESPPGERPATAEEPLAKEPAVAATATAEASFEPAVHDSTDTGGDSPLGRLELDVIPCPSGASEPPEEGPRRRRSRQQDGAEDDDFHLSQIELD